MKSICTTVIASFLLSIGPGGVAIADAYPSDTWVSDAKGDAIATYDATGTIFASLPNDPAFYELGGALKALGADLHYGLYAKIGPTNPKAYVRLYLEGTVKPEWLAVEAAFDNISAEHPELTDERMKLTAWVDFLTECVLGDVGNSHDAP